MKFETIIFCLAIMSITAGCDPHDGRLKLVNASKDTIYYYVGFCDDSIKSYPIKEKNGKIDYLFSNIIKPKQEQSIPVMDTWEYFIYTKCKDSTLRIFFFSRDLIRTAGKDSIMKYQLFSKKESLRVKDFEKLNWKVIYHEK